VNKQFILLDLDGTLTDPFEGITKAVRYALTSFGISVESPDELRKVIGPPLRASFMDFYGFSEEQAEAATAKYREYYFETGIFENFIYPGIPELLAELNAAGKTLVLATSKPTVYANRILEHFNLAQYIVFVSGSELSGERSEKLELIQYVFDNVAGAVAENSVMVGDRRHDIIGANAHGVTSVGVLYGYGSEQELRSAGATYIAATVDELRRILIRQP
jgi:phosphoglycolate phosphatase